MFHASSPDNYWKPSFSVGIFVDAYRQNTQSSFLAHMESTQFFVSSFLLSVSISGIGSQVRIPHDYNRHVYPPMVRTDNDRNHNDTGVNTVKIGFEILDVTKVDDDKHALTLRLGLSLLWNDTRSAEFQRQSEAF